MKDRLFLLVLAAVCSTAGIAQRPTKIGFQLGAFLAKADPNSTVDLFCQGEATDVARAVLTHGGRVKVVTKGWVSASVPVARVNELAADAAVKSFSFKLDHGHTLNDSMRVKAHVNEAYEGLAPLPQGYDGDGVIMGIIDTGLDFTHPDFQDSLGRTRVLYYWDQNYPVDAQQTPQPYGYGQAWDSTAINAGTCPATEPLNEFGHGTTVAGTAAGNGRATGNYRGVAPKSDLIIVANDLNHPNWNSSVVDAVQYIISAATALGRPVAINLSLGDYFGSHDGLDPAALMIDDMLTAQPGRVLVCAAGNSGNLTGYHMHTDVTSDTSFTWFRYNANSALGIGAMYFDLWADAVDFDNVSYSVGADKYTGGFASRGSIPYRSVQGTLGQIVEDTLRSVDGNVLGRVLTYAEARGDQYHMEVYIPQPDSAGAFYYRFSATGAGSYDVWSSNVFGTSEMVANVPTEIEFPGIAHYVAPDNRMSIVDAWACSPNVITVGNYCNELVYQAFDGSTQDLGGTEGAIAGASSRGPSRLGVIKPDVAAPGDITMSPGPLDFIQALIANGQGYKVAPDGLHMRNGGTSIASPVVAGTAALLLQKCARSTNTMVRDAINGAAFSDALTGVLPNVQFGHGKVDAFAALVSTNVQVPITGDTVVCVGDSVMLEGPDFMFSYHWSTGEEERDVYSSGGELTLTVENIAGCVGTSDTISVTPVPLPVPTISADGSVLTASDASSYQWNRFDEPIPGADQQSFELLTGGEYSVTVTDASGCTGTSSSILVIITGVDERTDASVSLWPVPTSDRLVVKSTFPIGDWNIIDAQGRAVLNGRSTDAPSMINVEGLAVGTYAFRFQQKGVVRSMRFVKQ